MEKSQIDREQNIKKELLQAQKSALGAIDYGRATLESLDVQDETLQGIEDTLEANEYVLNKSLKSLQGMTWAGYLDNQLVHTREIVAGYAEEPTPTNINNTATPETSQSVQRQVLETEKVDYVNREKDDLEELSAAVATLHQMSVDIGSQLDRQTTTIENIAEYTEKVTEKTLAVTIRASQLSERSRNRKPQCAGTIQLVDTVSGKYLAVVDDRLILCDKVGRSTYFTVLVKESHLFGLRNEKTLKFIGCAMLGHIICESPHFGTQEECYIDFSGKHTGILLIARHWGAGAWLKRPLADLLKEASESPNSAPHPYLTETTASINDKRGRIEFAVIKPMPKDKIED